MSPERAVLTPDPERFGGTKGRQIDLPANPEQFSLLEKGRDYSIIKKNDRVTADRPLEDFFVFVNPAGGDIERTVYPPHWRSITAEGHRATTRIRIKKDKGFTDEDIPFYAANTKGVGFLKPTAESIDFDAYQSWTRVDPEEQNDFGH